MMPSPLQCLLLVSVTAIASGSFAPLYRARQGDKIAGSYFVAFQANVELSEGIASVQNYLDAHFVPAGTIKHHFQRVFTGISGKFSELAIEVIRRLPQVKYVEEDQIMRTQQVASWGLDRIDERELVLDNEYTPHYTGEGMSVYVIDTGVLTTHTDFEGRAIHGYDAVDGDNVATDCNGHGSHCSGTVAGYQYGVAKKATIVAVRVLGCLGFGANEDVVAGMEWSLVDSNGRPTVVSMSLGGGPSITTDNAIEALNAGNVFPVVAAGNDNADASNSSPARSPYAMTVGATDRTDTRASFSNYGICVDIWAPGVAITSAWIPTDDSTNTISGTSMATPHVAGASALIREQMPSADVMTIRSTLNTHGTHNVISDLDSYSPNVLLHVYKKYEV